jgi:colanic acid/amylovoran biosynthesis glycosyltransferase
MEMTKMPDQQKIAYMMSRFPHLPEVFILREMEELHRQERYLALYPLIFQRQEVVHPEALQWIEEAHHLPFFSWSTFKANIRALTKKPYTYLRVWLQALLENMGSMNLLIRSLVIIPKAVYAAELMEAEGITHIHAHYATHPALASWVIHRLTNISYSMTVHAHDIFVHTAMMGTKMHDASFIAAISEFNRDYLVSKLGEWVRDKIHIIHCGITPGNYNTHSGKHKTGERLELITIGSLQPYKGQKYLIEAGALLRKRGIPFYLKIIGSGEERSNLEDHIKDRNLLDCVKLLGPKTQQEVSALLQTAHCYVQPSIITRSGKMEGIPVSIMEAMATELPVIATAISGIPELVKDGDTGYLVDPADASQIADAIQKVYQDPPEAARRAARGRDMVLREFDLESNVHKLSLLFDECREK